MNRFTVHVSRDICTEVSNLRLYADKLKCLVKLGFDRLWTIGINNGKLTIERSKNWTDGLKGPWQQDISDKIKLASPIFREQMDPFEH